LELKAEADHKKECLLSIQKYYNLVWAILTIELLTELNSLLERIGAAQFPT
jgi:hypothetical protein